MEPWSAKPLHRRGENLILGEPGGVSPRTIYDLSLGADAARLTKISSGPFDPSSGSFCFVVSPENRIGSLRCLARRDRTVRFQSLDRDHHACHRNRRRL